MLGKILSGCVAHSFLFFVSLVVSYALHACDERGPPPPWVAFWRWQVLGQGQPFQGFGSKILQPLQYLRTALAEGTLAQEDLVVFTDAFDTFFGASAASFAAAAAKAVPHGAVLFSVRTPCSSSAHPSNAMIPVASKRGKGCLRLTSTESSLLHAIPRAGGAMVLAG